MWQDKGKGLKFLEQQLWEGIINMGELMEEKGQLVNVCYVDSSGGVCGPIRV